MALVDIGANLAHDSFDEDRDDVMRRAAESGVKTMIVTGSSDASNVRALELAKQSTGTLYATAGVHPHHASEYVAASDTLIRELSSDDHVVAIGECGLDFFRDFSPREAQSEAFQQQLQIAVDTQLPVFLHQRDAHSAFLDILDPVLPHLTKAVAHCFTGEEPALRDYIERDLYVGITGWICDERRGGHLQDIVSLIPDDRLMIETDAPYLLPRTIRPRPKSRRNEPCFLPEILRVVAKCRQQSLDEVARLTSDNAKRFFALPNV